MSTYIFFIACCIFASFRGFNNSIICRSCPRPPVEHTGKFAQQSVSNSLHSLELQKPSKPGHSRHGSQSFIPEPSPNTRPEIATHLNGFLKRSTSRNVLPVTQTYAAENVRHEFSDATSSDWSLFTSSDEASFTTESTRDSFSTVDYGDSSNMDPITSLFNYTPQNSYMKFANSRSLTRFVPEKDHVKRVQRIDQSKDVSNHSKGNFGMHVNYRSNPMCGITRTSS